MSTRGCQAIHVFLAGLIADRGIFSIGMKRGSLLILISRGEENIIENSGGNRKKLFSE